MAAFPPHDLPVLSTLAREFAVCDHYFSSVPGPTAQPLVRPCSDVGRPRRQYHGAWSEAETRQPTMERLKASMMNAT